MILAAIGFAVSGPWQYSCHIWKFAVRFWIGLLCGFPARVWHNLRFPAIRTDCAVPAEFSQILRFPAEFRRILPDSGRISQSLAPNFLAVLHKRLACFTAIIQADGGRLRVEAVKLL